MSCLAPTHPCQDSSHFHAPTLNLTNKLPAHWNHLYDICICLHYRKSYPCIFCGNKCQLLVDATEVFYCRYYCLLNMFRAPLCPLSLICGNKMPTRCNRGIYCRSYCLLNMFRAPLYPSSGAQEYYTVVCACGISCCGFQFADLLRS